MKQLKRKNIFIKSLAILLIIVLFFYVDFVLFAFTYFLIVLFLIQRAIRIKSRKSWKVFLIITYVMIFVAQITFIELVTFSDGLNYINKISTKCISILLAFFPFYIERFVTVNKYTEFYLPSLSEVKTVSFYDFLSAAKRVSNIKNGIIEVKDHITFSNIKEIVKDLPNHSSIKYINKDSLPENYFDKAYESLSDENIYIVISNTGSPASDVLSVFTRKQFNHASISFDKELETIISYNGGAKVYPPGLNHELIEFFNQKVGASIIVYKLKTTKEQKSKLIDKIKEINEEGSAYNMMGVVLKYSHKPNIMFCSQFVYTILKDVGLEYFDAKSNFVRPTDLIELDYYRKLQYDYSITFE